MNVGKLPRMHGDMQHFRDELFVQLIKSRRCLYDHTSTKLQESKVLNRRRAWDELSNEMGDLGFQMTVYQAKNKWANVKMAFRTFKREFEESKDRNNPPLWPLWSNMQWYIPFMKGNVDEVPNAISNKFTPRVSSAKRHYATRIGSVPETASGGYAVSAKPGPALPLREAEQRPAAGSVSLLKSRHAAIGGGAKAAPEASWPVESKEVVCGKRGAPSLIQGGSSVLAPRNPFVNLSTTNATPDAASREPLLTKESPAETPVGKTPATQSPACMDPPCLQQPSDLDVSDPIDVVDFVDVESVPVTIGTLQQPGSRSPDIASSADYPESSRHVPAADHPPFSQNATSPGADSVTRLDLPPIPEPVANDDEAASGSSGGESVAPRTLEDTIRCVKSFLAESKSQLPSDEGTPADTYPPAVYPGSPGQCLPDQCPPEQCLPGQCPPEQCLHGSPGEASGPIVAGGRVAAGPVLEDVLFKRKRKHDRGGRCSKRSRKDEYDHFARIVAASLRELPEQLAHKARLDIDRYMYELKYCKCDDDTQ